jgi:hypothetical protein
LWSIQIIPPYMSPSALVQKLERAAYSPNTSLTTTEYLAYERALSVYIKKAVDAYIAPKLPTYVPEPAPIPSGTVITGEAYNTYWNQTNANKAWRKAATTAVINAVQQIQLQMGSASDQQTTSRAFISQWNKDPVPALVTTPRTTPTTTPITTPGSEPGCTSAGPYSTTTGRLCATSSVVPGCIPGYLFSPLSGNPCNTISVSSASNILSNNWYYRNFSYSSSDEDSATSDSSTDPTLVCTGSETTATCHPEWSVAGSLCNASTMSGACSPDRVNPYAAATLAKKVVAQGKAKGNTIFCSAKYTPFRPSIDPSTGLSYYYNTTCEVNGTAGIDAKTLVR